MKQNAAEAVQFRVGVPDEELKRHLVTTGMTHLGAVPVASRFFEVEWAPTDEVAAAATGALHAQTDAYATQERKSLETFDDERRAHLSEYLKKDRISPWLDTLLYETGEEGCLEALMKKDGDGEYVLSNGTLVNFLEMHNYALAAQQREAEPVFAAHKATFIAKLRLATERGWLPVSVLDRLDSTVAVPVCIDGGLTAMGNLAGYVPYAPEGAEQRDYIAVNYPEIHSTHVLTHELLHVAAGQWTDEDEPEKYHTSSLAARFGVAGRWLNEAVTEHMTRSLVYDGTRELPLIGPIEGNAYETAEGAVYQNERYLLQQICLSGVKPIAVGDFIAVYFESEASYQKNPGHSAMEKLQRSLEEAYPSIDIVAKLRELEDAMAIGVFVEEIWRSTRQYALRHPLKTVRAART